MKNSKKHLVICGAVILLFAILSTFCFFGPKATYSDSERRPLADFPELSWKNMVSGQFMDEFETYAADTFPLREVFRGIKSQTTLFAMGQKTNNDIYLHEGYLSALEYPMDTDSIQHAADVFQGIYETYLKDANTNVFVSVIPDKNAYLASSAGQLCMDYKVFEAEFETKTSAFASYISISDLLSAEDYYYTDSHWRQENLADVADRLMSTMHYGNTSSQETPLISYTTIEWDKPFYGVYKGQSALPHKGDTLRWLSNDIIDQMSAYDHQNQTAIPVYNTDKAAGKDPYEVFLSGPLSLVTIENPMVNTQKELILFRDSFGSSIAPLLAQGYHKVTLIDIRYLPSNMIGKYVDFSNSDVLFLYSTSVLNNSETLK